MENETPKKPMQEQWKLALKFVITIFILLLMMIPITLVRRLVNERSDRNEQVIHEVASKWGLQQNIIGPYIEVPYTVVKDKETYTKIAYIMCKDLDINGNLGATNKKRSIYDVTLYDVKLTINGNFKDIDWRKLNIPIQNLDWKNAKLLLGVSDMRGLNSAATISWDQQQPITLTNNPNNAKLINEGLSTSITYDQLLNSTFSIDLKLNGSQRLYFTPNAQQASINLSASYPHPSFNGYVLPNTTHNKDGFQATWKTLSNHSKVPIAWLDEAYDLSAGSFGVDLITTANNYNKTERVIKYALLFISLSFGVFFLIETIKNLLMHPIHYVLIGVALVIFYSLLLSISEFIGFNKAYVIASVATILLISLYLSAIFPKKSMALNFGVGLSILYAYVFFIIQLEDLSLLFGSIALFILLAATMFYTRKLNWRNLQQS